MPGDPRAKIRRVAEALAKSERPVLVISSQTLVNQRDPERIANAIRALGIPTYPGGMGRGLLGRTSDIQFRHERSKALREADLVIVAGFPFDFRLKCGQAIPKCAKLVAVSLSADALRKNRIPDVAIRLHPGEMLVELAALSPFPPIGVAGC